LLDTHDLDPWFLCSCRLLLHGPGVLRIGEKRRSCDQVGPMNSRRLV